MIGEARTPSGTAPRWALWTLALLAAALLVACGTSPGPGPDPDPDPDPDPIEEGQLIVTVTGLPPGVAARVSVAGDDGDRELTSTTTLTLPVGNYRVVASTVFDAGGVMSDRYEPEPGEQSVTVVEDVTAQASVDHTHYPALLLAPAFSAGVRVLQSEDLMDAGEPSRSWRLREQSPTAVTGIAVGPDGRVYFADFDADEIVVLADAAWAEDGTVSRAATITHGLLEAPVGLAFDGSGALWVGSDHGAGARVLRFEAADVAAAVGAAELEPALVLGVPGSDETTRWLWDLFIDLSDRLWLVDFAGEALLRYDDLAGESGEVNVAPSLTLRAVADSSLEAGRSLPRPTSLVVDEDDVVYVGTASHVARFDALGELQGDLAVPADAYLRTGIAQPELVALDRSGALWVGHYEGALVRLLDPSGFDGDSDVSGSLDRTLRWHAADEFANPQGGNLTFVPTQGPHRGF